MSEHPSPPAARQLDLEALRQWPLPQPQADGDKETRGRLMVIAGSAEMPGAAILSAEAALRAGVGKLTVVTGETIAPGIALAVPEARVVGVPVDEHGQVAPSALTRVIELLARMDAVLMGPGMQPEVAVAALVAQLLPHCTHSAVILDAAAMGVLARQPRFEQPVLLTPHAGEMAHLSGMSKAEVCEDPSAAAWRAARRWNALVALKGACTVIASADGEHWQHRGGNVGLAISGSGDTLSGVIAGLAARGAPLTQAAAWGVALHARAGELLARRRGLLGYLAREIPAEVPGLMSDLGPGP